MKISQLIEQNLSQKTSKVEFMGLRFRLTPSAEQKKIINQTLGNSRFVYNYGLRQTLDYWERNKDLPKDKREPYLNSSMLSAQLTQLKKELWVLDTNKINTLPEYQNINWLSITAEQFHTLPKIYWLEHNCLSTALQQSLKHMENARQRFFKKQSGFPQFKKKSHSSSCTITTNNINFVFKDEQKRNDYLATAKVLQDNALKNNFKISSHTLLKEKLNSAIENYDLILSKTSKPLHIHWDGRSFKANDIKSINLSKSSSGKYYITFLVPINNQNLNQEVLSTHNQVLQIGDTAGIDMGIKTTATLYSKLNNSIIEKKLNNFKRYEKRLARAQRSLSKKKKGLRIPNKVGIGSNNFNKQRVKVAKVHENLVNYRTDFYQQFSTEIFKHYHTVIIEDLNIKGMVKNRKLAKHISLQSWGQFYQMLMYKAGLYNKEIVVTDRYFPSSKLCSNCHHYNRYYGLLEKPLNKNGKNKLHMPDMWTCSHCAVNHQRDENAAKNLANYLTLKDTYKDIMTKSIELDLIKIYQTTNGINDNQNIKNNSTGELPESGLANPNQMSTAELLRPKLNITVENRQNSKTKPQGLANGETDNALILK